VGQGVAVLVKLGAIGKTNKLGEVLVSEFDLLLSSARSIWVIEMVSGLQATAAQILFDDTHSLATRTVGVVVIQGDVRAVRIGGITMFGRCRQA
jgi:hypothetical protein